MADPTSFVLWIRSPHPDHSRLKRPAALFSAASEREVMQWREDNAWADSIPLILWGGPELPKSAVPFMLPHGSAPWQVDGVKGWQPLFGVKRPATVGDAIGALASSAAEIAAKIKGPVWEICAGASEGVLSIGVASAKKGWGVALEVGSPSILTSAVARDWGVSITVREHDVDAPKIQPDQIRSWGGI